MAAVAWILGRPYSPTGVRHNQTETLPKSKKDQCLRKGAAVRCGSRTADRSRANDVRFTPSKLKLQHNETHARSKNTAYSITELALTIRLFGKMMPSNFCDLENKRQIKLHVVSSAQPSQTLRGIGSCAKSPPPSGRDKDTPSFSRSIIH